MTGYTKLFGSIIDSTIWRESKETKIVWITLLAKCNRDGIVEASIPGLADAARVTIPECLSALEVLKKPDPYSRTKEHDGRRVEDVDGGWKILNHAKYRGKFSKSDRLEYQAHWQRGYRQRLKDQAESSRTINNPQTPTEHPPTSTKKAFVPPTIDQLKAAAAPLGLPDTEIEKFFHFYSSNGWKVGKNKMQSLSHALAGWAVRWRQSNGTPSGKPGVPLTREQQLAVARGDMKDPSYEQQ